VAPKLLLADDSVTIQRVIELTFADEDITVTAVGDGQQAIARVQADPPDIVLADVGMPERDGYEVAAFIKGDPKLAHIPVLLLTGAFEPVDEVRARAVGCDGVLVKPFEPQMVISRVRDLLAGKREPQAAAKPAAAAARLETAAAEKPAHSLEDYFDRLDAALASKASQQPPPEPIRPAADARVKVSAPPAEPPSSHLPAAPKPVPAPAPRAVPSAAPVPPPAVDSSREVELQDAFAALLAAEQAPAPTAVQALTRLDVEAIPAEVIDEIARRVIARMGDDSMRAAVLDAAERLVREEISRIKAQN
jgi:CheY-like chemotaxis protein